MSATTTFDAPWKTIVETVKTGKLSLRSTRTAGAYRNDAACTSVAVIDVYTI